MSIILNEREYAEKILLENTLTSKPIEALSVVAKYYYSEGYRRADIVRLLEAYILKSDPSANIVKWQPAIDRLARGAGKYPLVQIDGVPITEAEIASCLSLSGRQTRRLLFTLICFAKFYNLVFDHNNCWTNRQDREIFKAANIIVSTERQALMMNDLRSLGMVEFSRKVDSVNSRVLCVCDDSPDALLITDFRNLGNQFSMLCGEPYIECSSCGLVVKKSSNRQKYCKQCAEEVNKQHAKESFRSEIAC